MRGESGEKERERGRDSERESERERVREGERQRERVRERGREKDRDEWIISRKRKKERKTERANSKSCYQWCPVGGRGALRLGSERSLVAALVVVSGSSGPQAVAVVDSSSLLGNTCGPPGSPGSSAPSAATCLGAPAFNQLLLLLLLGPKSTAENNLQSGNNFQK